MSNPAVVKSTRRPRFRRAAEPPAFRLTDDDIEIVRQLARHRFLRSTHIAALVSRSLDRTNDRLHRLFHAGYIDRPRAQLDYYPDRGGTPMVYALADRGAQLLVERAGSKFSNLERSRNNSKAGRPFIEHQLAIIDFYVSVQIAAKRRNDITVLHADELAASFPDQSFSASNPFTLQTRFHHHGTLLNVGLIPDLVFGLRFRDGSRRCFMVEIDRGTMPITRTNVTQSSFERKMLAYLSVHAARQHELHFGWKTFRVLALTTSDSRLQSMKEALQRLHVPYGPGPPLFFFATRLDLSGVDLLQHNWQDGSGRNVCLV